VHLLIDAEAYAASFDVLRQQPAMLHKIEQKSQQVTFEC
jgi:hypothetical protein